MKIAKFIDHTLLKPDATCKQIERICREGMEYGFASVCVNPAWVPLVASLIKGSDVKVCTVVGFPLGASTPKAKACEAEDSVSNGAEELDMVMNIGALKSGCITSIKKEIEEILKAGVLLKVIIETGLLSEEEKTMACVAVKEAGAHFVKTCTGFGPGGATVQDVKLMRRIVGEEIGVKASGGIRNLSTCRVMLEAGANRIGTSTGVQIAEEANDE